jgi:hypothetical protein
MIKKILGTILVSSVMFLGVATSSFSMDRPTVAIGGALTYGGYVASGKEHEGRTGQLLTGVEENDATAAMEVGYSSVFLEVNFADRLTVGVEYMADTVETEIAERTDTLTTQVGEALGDVGTSQVKASFSNFTTVYGELRLFNGVYFKAGQMEIDIESKETLHTSSTYGNLTIDGSTYGIGYKNSWDNGMFLKTETMIHNWDNFTLSAVSADAVPNNNKITGDMDGIVASLRIGKAF